MHELGTLDLPLDLGKAKPSQAAAWEDYEGFHI
jgi:hypothetical protein